MAEEAFADHPENDKTGGPAFPFVSHGGFHEHQYIDPGMTLRDWFAAQALVGLLAHASGESPHTSPSMAYQLADEMLLIRNKGEDK